ELAVAASHATVVHPAGSPVYVVVGHLFTLLPWGDAAYRLNLMSAVFATLTFLVTGAIIHHLAEPTPTTARRTGAVLGALAVAFSPVFWSQALIAEVYTLHMFLFALFCLLLLIWRGLPERAWQRSALVCLMGLVLGLGLGNHVTFGVVIPSSLGFLVLMRWGGARFPLRHALFLLPGLVGMGVGAYLLLPLWAQQTPWASPWDPTDFSRLWDHVSGGPFKGLLLSAPAWSIPRMLAVGSMVLRQYGWLGFLVAIVGSWETARTDKPVLAFGGLTAALTVLFAVMYPVYDSEVYLLPFYWLLGVAFGVGATMAAVEIQQFVATRLSFPGRPQSKVQLASALTALLLFTVPAGSYLGNRGQLDVSQDTAAYSYARTTLAALPPHSLLLSGSPIETLALWYLQHEVNWRTDVLVLDTFWLHLNTYQRNLARVHPDLAPPAGTANYLQHIIENSRSTRPIYGTESSLDKVTSSRVQLDGALYRVLPQ
ncbi:MAG: DUF2723 domain-containing protein, partial [Chloroflexota bacterium]